MGTSTRAIRMLDPTDTEACFVQDVSGNTWLQPLEIGVEGQAKLGNFRLEFNIVLHDAGRMLSLTDPGGNTRSWTYDALHRAI